MTDFADLLHKLTEEQKKQLKIFKPLMEKSGYWERLLKNPGQMIKALELLESVRASGACEMDSEKMQGMAMGVLRVVVASRETMVIAEKPDADSPSPKNFRN